MAELKLFYEEYGVEGVELFLAGRSFKEAEAEKQRTVVLSDLLTMEELPEFTEGVPTLQLLDEYAEKTIEDLRVAIDVYKKQIVVCQAGIDQMEAIVRDR